MSNVLAYAKIKAPLFSLRRSARYESSDHFIISADIFIRKRRVCSGFHGVFITQKCVFFFHLK